MQEEKQSFDGIHGAATMSKVQTATSKQLFKPIPINSASSIVAMKIYVARKI